MGKKKSMPSASAALLNDSGLYHGGLEDRSFVMGSVPEEALALPSVVRGGIKFPKSKSTTGNKIDPEGVNHPSHYNVDPSGVECIDIVRHRNFNIGNAIKYLWRNGLKDNADGRAKQINDLEKAIWYTQDEIKRLKSLDLKE